MNPRVVSACALAASLALLSGCGHSGGGSVTGTSGGGTRADLQRSEVASVLAQTPEVIDDLEFENPQFTEVDLDADVQGDLSADLSGSLSAGELLSSRHSLRWWRTIQHVERHVEYAFADSDSTGEPQSAIVTITRDLTGTFHVQNGNGPHRTDAVVASHDDDDDDGEDGDGEHGGGGHGCPGHGRPIKSFTKPLEDHWVRRVKLERIAPDSAKGDTARCWKVVATSAVEVSSTDRTIEIQSVRVQSANLDTTLATPLDLWRLRRLLVFTPHEKVTLTVTTNGDSGDAVSFLRRDRRGLFKPEGNGVYTLRWKAPNGTGVGHLGINALTEATLFDPEGPYDSHAWILPFVVRGHECGYYLPRD